MQRTRASAGASGHAGVGRGGWRIVGRDVCAASASEMPASADGADDGGDVPDSPDGHAARLHDGARYLRCPVAHLHRRRED